MIYLELRTTPKVYCVLLENSYFDHLVFSEAIIYHTIEMQRNDSKGMSKRSYMEAVLEGIKSVNSVEVDLSGKLNTDASAHSHSNNDLCNGTENKKIYVRLLLSIDRRETAEAAMETVS